MDHVEDPSKMQSEFSSRLDVQFLQNDTVDTHGALRKTQLEQGE